MSDRPASPVASPADGEVTIEQLAQPLVQYEETFSPLPSGLRFEETLNGTGKTAGSPRSPASPAVKEEHSLLKRDLVPLEGVGHRPKEVLDVSEVLDLLFPPIDTEEMPGYGRAVSKEAATNLDVIAMQEQLELRQKLRSARSEGVCVQREDIYRQCFDEIVRQVASACPERGLLLYRVRDEVNMTIEGYKALIETASSLAMRKVIHRGIQHEIEKELLDLEYEVQIQQKRVQALAAKLGKTKKIIDDRQKLQETQHEEEIRFIKKGNVQLNNELKRLTAAASG